MRADAGMSWSCPGQTTWLHEWLSTLRPCSSMLDFKGALCRSAAWEDTRNFKTHQYRQPWPKDIPCSLLCSKAAVHGSEGLQTRRVHRHHHNHSQCWELDLAILPVYSYSILEMYHITHPRINNPALFLDTWLLPVLLSFNDTLSRKPEKHPRHLKDSKYFNYKNYKNHQRTVNYIHDVCQLYYWCSVKYELKKEIQPWHRKHRLRFRKYLVLCLMYLLEE